VAAELRIFGFVDDAHTAATERTEDAIVGDGSLSMGRGEMRMVDAGGFRSNAFGKMEAGRG